MGSYLRVFAVVLASSLITAVAVGLIWQGEGTLLERTRRLAFHGRPLIEVRLPQSGQQVPVGGIEVLVSFPGAHRVAADSFRCRLNNRDVTELLTVGQNGAAGSVYGLVEGENRLEIEFFGRTWWGPRFFLDRRTIVFQASPFLSLDRA
jgi:hypothetical protein